ncbi:MAG: polyketide cyclase [Nocardioidaceae bacterium]|nr:polyketide cyclase [Nocardioidaceae bacterium]
MVLPVRPAAVHAVLVDLEHFGDWWPQVRAVAKLGEDDALVVCRSLLPYDLELHLHAESRAADLLRVAIDGPIRGYAQWRLTAERTAWGDDGGTRLEFEQRVHAVARVIRLTSYVAKPVLRANHAWMMRGAQRGLLERFRPASPRG